jgi:hypothetical protein
MRERHCLDATCGEVQVQWRKCRHRRETSEMTEITTMWRMRCAGRRDGPPGPETGLFVERIGPGALQGRGWVRWTADPRDAMRWRTPAHAEAVRRAIPVLAVFRVEIERAL